MRPLTTKRVRGGIVIKASPRVANELLLFLSHLSDAIRDLKNESRVAEVKHRVKNAKARHTASEEVKKRAAVVYKFYADCLSRDGSGPRADRRACLDEVKKRFGLLSVDARLLLAEGKRSRQNID